MCAAYGPQATGAQLWNPEVAKPLNGLAIEAACLSISTGPPTTPCFATRYCARRLLTSRSGGDELSEVPGVAKAERGPVDQQEVLPISSTTKRT
jgi:hypothetical protein